MENNMDNNNRENELRSNVARIEEVLHSHARDCEVDRGLIDMLIDRINLATRNGFPGLNNCTRKYEVTVTLTVPVEADSEEDARDEFITSYDERLFAVSGEYRYDVRLQGEN